jgi:hypothetical protein
MTELLILGHWTVLWTVVGATRDLGPLTTDH